MYSGNGESKDFFNCPSIKHSKFDTINEVPFLSIDCNLDKGQLISKCPFSVIVSTKIPIQKFFKDFCPSL